MVMDYVRSCYTTRMRFFRDNQLEIPVRWYFCKPNARIFPHYTRFGSGNWAGDKYDWRGAGEVAEIPRPWSNGETLALADGQHFCGSVDDFAQGAAFDPSFNARDSACMRNCRPLIVWGDGGRESDGAAEIIDCVHTDIFVDGHEMPCILWCNVSSYSGPSPLEGSFRIFFDGLVWRGGHAGCFDFTFDTDQHDATVFLGVGLPPCIVPGLPQPWVTADPFLWQESIDTTPLDTCCDPVTRLLLIEVSSTRRRTFVANGGVQAGGAAEVNTGNGITGTGGVEANGAATLEFGYSFVASGGVAANGSAELLADFAIRATGGVEANGAAELVRPSTIVASGGVEADGAAIIGRPRLVIASGGVEANGAAVIT